MRHLDVLVADKHPIYALGLQTALSDPKFDFSIHIKGVAANGEEVRDLLHSSDPDLLLLDLGLPEMDGLQWLPAVKKNHAKTRVLVLAANQTTNLAQDAFDAGADGFMLKSSTKDELLEAISQIVEGKRFLGNFKLAQEQNRDEAQGFAARYGLTTREMEILQHIAQAKDNQQIGAQLFISHQTVSVHRKNIMRKLGVNSTASLIKIAFENRLF